MLLSERSRTETIDLNEVVEQIVIEEDLPYEDVEYGWRSKINSFGVLTVQKPNPPEKEQVSKETWRFEGDELGNAIMNSVSSNLDEWGITSVKEDFSDETNLKVNLTPREIVEDQQEEEEDSNTDEGDFPYDWSGKGLGFLVLVCLGLLIWLIAF